MNNINELPLGSINIKEDNDYINIIRNQILPPGIEDSTTSELSDEIKDIVSLLTAYTQEDSIEQIKQVIFNIHSKFNDKSEQIVRSWIRELKYIHPKIEQYINENLEYFRIKYSELIGTNTVLYYADMNSSELIFWAQSPKYRNSNIEWTTDVNTAPSYIRETVRHKLPDNVVEYIQNSSHITSILFARNLIRDVYRTTEDLTGNVVAQKRPISKNIAHGTTLNTDWYYQVYEIVDNNIKQLSKEKIIQSLDKNGYWIHVMVNHLTPLLFNKRLNPDETLISIEETFPHKDNADILVGSNGQVISSATKVNESALKPEELK